MHPYFVWGFLTRKHKWVLVFLFSLLLIQFYGVVGSRASASSNSDNLPPTGSLIVPDDYPTIEAAIDNANVGDTVYVKKGTYSYTGGGDDAIRIDKPLSLIGEDSQKTVITRTEGYLKYTYNVISITADNVTISGFTIIGNWGLTGIRSEGSGIKIIGNNIASSMWGILGGGYIISQNNITGNDFGIAFSSSNSVISGNNITGNHFSGITIGSQNVTIKENNISANGMGPDEGDGMGFGGLVFWIANDVRVYENNITDNQFGVRFSRSCNNSEVYNNNIMRNGLGINVQTHALGVGNKIYYNNLVDNNQSALVQQNVTDVVSWDNGKVGNYWSDYQLKYPNASEVDGSGIGDTTYMIDENNKDRYPILESFNVGPPKISVLSPIAQTYNETSVPLVFTVGKLINWTGYSLDGAENVTIAGNTTLTWLSSGLHNVTVYAKDLLGNVGVSETVVFTAEPFPTAWVIAAVVIIAVVGFIIIVYFKKRKTCIPHPEHQLSTSALAKFQILSLTK
jgi:parallel beta-helix repeat protein